MSRTFSLKSPGLTGLSAGESLKQMAVRLSEPSGFMEELIMFTLQKPKNRDFRVLNLTDTHLVADEWECKAADNGRNRRILEYTIGSLIAKTKPDLITVSGDITFADSPRADSAYENFSALLESYRIPWAFVWGNHDNQAGAEVASHHADIMLSRGHCLFEKGDPAMGCGNYIIKIEEDGKPIHAIFMMDSHDRFDFTEPDGKVTKRWAHLMQNQLDWQREESRKLALPATLIMHMPYYAYHDAFAAAWNGFIDPKTISPAESRDPKYWKEGYKTAYGAKYEGVGSYPVDTGDFDYVNAGGYTKLTLVGHEHVNDYVIDYKGMKLVYSLKTGAGCYWDQRLNGGTLLKISDKGAGVEHVHVDVDFIVND